MPWQSHKRLSAFMNESNLPFWRITFRLTPCNTKRFPITCSHLFTNVQDLTEVITVVPELSL